jgi:hypothetical protein
MASGQSPGDDLDGRGRSCQFLAADVDLPGGPTKGRLDYHPVEHELAGG